jgi:phosphoglycolate phosphatase-like HAD superfamily hydrolase
MQSLGKCPWAFICDFDDTLIAARRTYMPVMVDALSRFGYCCQGLEEAWGRPFEEVVETVAPGLDFKRFLDSYTTIVERTSPCWLPGALHFLSGAKERGLPLFILTASSGHLIRVILEKAGIMDAVTDIWGSEHTTFHKPDGRVFRPCVARLTSMGVPVSDAVYIGDDITDWEAAKDAGIPFVAVLTGRTPGSRFQDHGLSKSLIFDNILNVSHVFLGTESD